ncbi:MAG: DNA recombination protein RmuC [Candidatus Kapaibacterium sp.]
MSPEFVPYLLLAFVLGLALGYLLIFRKLASSRTEKSDFEKEIAALKTENQRIEGLEEQKMRLTQAVQNLERDKLNLQRDKESLEKTANEVPTLKETITNTEKTSREVHEVNVKLTAEMKAMEVWYDKAKSNFTGMFATLSEEALRANRGSFLDLARESLGKYQEAAKGDLEKRQQSIQDLIKPVGETLEKFDKRVQELEVKREGAYSSLSEQVRSLTDGQTQLRTETSNLVRALRTPHTRGRWGEIQLRRVAELAGMLKYCDFREQVSESTEDGDKKPDMIVRLPGGKNVIVDAKMVFDAYSDAMIDNVDDNTRILKLKQHAQQVRDRIKKLSAKSYWEQFQPTPEFVVLFLPGESLLYAALEQDPKLIEDGMTDKVIFATPTTLIAMLKAIYYGWRQEDIAENARNIRDLAAELYKNLTIVGGHLSSIGSGLETAVKSYNKSIGSIETNLIKTARSLKEDYSIPTGDRELEDLEQIETGVRLIKRLELFPAPVAPAAGPDGKLLAEDQFLESESSIKSSA